MAAYPENDKSKRILNIKHEKDKMIDKKIKTTTNRTKWFM